MCVLLVEDEALISTIMTECLVEAGYDVIAAADGAEALRLIADPPVAISLLVTDVHLAEGPTGLDVAREIRLRLPDLRVIVATGRPDALNDLPATERPFRLLRKPYRPGELIGAISAAIGPGPHAPGPGVVKSAGRGSAATPS